MGPDHILTQVERWAVNLWAAFQMLEAGYDVLYREGGDRCCGAKGDDVAGVSFATEKLDEDGSARKV